MVCLDESHALDLTRNRLSRGGKVVYHLHEGCFSQVAFPANETWLWDDVVSPVSDDWIAFRCGMRLVRPVSIQATVDNRCGEPGWYQGKGNIVFTKK
jgi:hypothetical protein